MEYSFSGQGVASPTFYPPKWRIPLMFRLYSAKRNTSIPVFRSCSVDIPKNGNVEYNQVLPSIRHYPLSATL